MKRYLYFALCALILLIACGTIPGFSSTATVPPEPTFTPLPSATSTRVPTATPNATVTAEAKATQAADDMADNLGKLLGEDTDIPYESGYLMWKYDDPIDIKLTGPDSRVLELDNRLKAGDFILKTDVTWKATGIIICGLVFRSEEDLVQGAQYQFVFLRLSGLPAWSIEFHEFGQFRNSPTKVKYSSALLQGNDATNQVILVARGGEFTLYINRVRQGRYFDTSEQRKDGIFAFLGLQESGKGSCTYENSWIWSLEPPGNGPSTWTNNELLKMI